jgi:large subunit ribosomal protein L21
VVGQVVEQGRGAKILVFHYKRKKQYKKLRGHRQSYTAVRISEIAFGGQSFKAPELPKKEAKPKKVKAAEAESEAPAEATPHKSSAKKKAAPKKAAKKSGSKK